MAPAPKVVIPIADGCEEMEVVICADILRRAGAEVWLAGVDGTAAVTASRGVRLLPDCSWSECADAPMDLLLLPGGAGGVERLRQSTSLRSKIIERSAGAEKVAAICAAPSLLAELDVLRDKRVTSYPGALDPQSTEYQFQTAAVVVDGALTSSRGPGTAMDFALDLVVQLFGRERGVEVEAALQRPSVYL
ncbi:DJ-1 family glyoxalase III [Acidithiobacillus sp. AMEEHan]|uniref:DJ-1 family glyoxalase III n=1 Tax=Acidithiobacillus sp. AMEEHan TaxID=2994951 RepID=UPI0027E53FEE|nr:DJ-1 family glyoxalase III [Acidithiobacillus sp. AMEEHan]